MNLDLEQYKMVKEALHERHNLLEIAPHLSFPLPIMLPVYRWWQVKNNPFQNETLPTLNHWTSEL